MRSTRSAHRQKKLALLYGLSRLVNEPTGLNEQLAQALELVCYAVDAEKALIATFDATDKSAVIKSVLRYPNELKNTRINLSEDTVLSVLYNTGEGMRVSETNYERKYDTASYAAPTMLLAPLRTQGAVTGALLCAGKKNMRDFTPDESLLLETAGPLLSTMLNEKNDSETAQSAAQVKNDYVLPYNRQ
jgi:transcriptional regulator with GAF, ATPase, and Fis domain